MLISGPIAEQAVLELQSGCRSVDDGIIEGLAAEATEGGRSAEAIARFIGARVQIADLPRGVFGLRAPGLILVAPFKSAMARDIAVTHECAHGVLRRSRHAHQHADVWALFVALMVPLRCLAKLPVLSPVAVAAELGVPCWVAWVRLQMPVVQVSMGGRTSFSLRMC